MPNEPVRKTLFVKDLKPKDLIRTSFLVKAKSLLLNRQGKPYLAMMLSDKTGEIDTRVWEPSDELVNSFQEGDVIAVSGKAVPYQNRLQLVLDHLVPLEAQEIELVDYLPAARGDVEAMWAKLIETFEGLKNPWVRDLSLALLHDPEIASRYKRCPAAKTIHHAYVGGLLSHSLQLTKLVDAILPLYEDLDRDILLFGAVFHDFGKIFELSYDGSFGYTDEGRLVGHIAIGTCLIDRKLRGMPEFPVELEWQLKHMVLSHHGKLEYGSPKRPHTVEAQVLAMLDDMDSKIESIQSFTRAPAGGARWTGHHRAYDQYYYRPDKYLDADNQA